MFVSFFCGNPRSYLVGEGVSMTDAIVSLISTIFVFLLLDFRLDFFAQLLASYVFLKYLTASVFLSFVVFSSCNETRLYQLRFQQVPSH